MTKHILLIICLAAFTGNAFAADTPKPTAAKPATPKTPAKKKGKQEDVISIGGMSIIGNRELPKSLYIVPWKESSIESEADLSRDLLNENAGVVDQEEFVRQLNYYDLSN